MAAARPLLLLTVLAACAAAAEASAKGAPHVFRIRVTATATATWDHTTAPVQSGDCTVAIRSEGTRTVRFHSRVATLVHFVDGRIRTVSVRSLEGTVTTSGTNTRREICDGRPIETPEQCAPVTRRFSNARATLSSRGAGVIVVRPLRVVLERSTCPSQPGDITAMSLGPPPGPLHVTSQSLANDRVVTITFTASATRTKEYRQPEAGSLLQRSAWKLTLARVQS